MGVCGREAERVLGCCRFPCPGAPTSSAPSHCSPLCVLPHITALPQSSLSLHATAAKSKHNPLKSVSLGRKSANTCLQRNRQWQMDVLPTRAPSTSERETTFILGNSSLARPRQRNLNQPLHYHGKPLFDLPSLEMGV